MGIENSAIRIRKLGTHPKGGSQKDKSAILNTPLLQQTSASRKDPKSPLRRQVRARSSGPGFFTWLHSLHSSLFPRPGFASFVFLIFVLYCSYAHSAQVTLRWDPVVTHPNLAGYKIYYGNSSRNYDDTTDVGNQTSWTITDLIDTESYYFAVTAYDIYANESGYSNEVSVTFSDSSAVFVDVPSEHWAEDFIYTIYGAGITKGCSQNPLRYCPDKVVNRAIAAVLLLRSIHGGDYIPPPATGLFTDLPRWHWAAPWAEQLSREGITGGCSGNPQLYCPDRVVNRAVAAVLWVRTFGL